MRDVRRGVSFLVAIVAALALGWVAPAHASGNRDVGVGASAAVKGINSWRNRATGACMDDSPYGLRAFPCNGLPFQTWHNNVNGFLFTMLNAATYRCLDDS